VNKKNKGASACFEIPALDAPQIKRELEKWTGKIFLKQQVGYSFWEE
jgi:hypothetical protein